MFAKEFGIFALFLLISSCKSQTDRFCISNDQCPPRYQCVNAASGLLTCQPQRINNDLPNGMDYKYCVHDRDCQEVSSKCVRYGWYGVCQRNFAGNSAPNMGNNRGQGAVDDWCNSDSDCGASMQCVDYKGANRCQIAPGFFPFRLCGQDHECSYMERCVYSNQYKRRICRSNSDSANDRIGDGVQPMVPNIPGIGSGVVPPVSPRLCTVDYQCRIGESCEINGYPSGRTCVYDPMNTKRQCRFHADCLRGQQCERNLSGTFICMSLYPPAINMPCRFDFECSGGDRCVATRAAHNLQNIPELRCRDVSAP